MTDTTTLTATQSFDFATAIADLDFRGFGYNDAPDLSGLHSRYPEIAFVFDRLDSLPAELDRQGDELRVEAALQEQALMDEITDLECRNIELRGAVLDLALLALNMSGNVDRAGRADMLTEVNNIVKEMIGEA